MITITTVPVTTTGTAGSASGSANSEPLSGRLVGVFIDYDGSAPATTTVVITEKSGFKRTILNKAASATDVVHYPTIELQDTAGASFATKQYGGIYLSGSPLTVAVANSNALAPAVTVSIMTEEQRP